MAVFPILDRADTLYFITNLYCDECGEIEDYDIALGLFFGKGYYCKACHKKITKTIEKRITKKEFNNRIEILNKKLGICPK